MDTLMDTIPESAWEAPEMQAFFRLHTKTLNFLMGKVMQATDGKANPVIVKRLLIEKLYG